MSRCAFVCKKGCASRAAVGHVVRGGGGGVHVVVLVHGLLSADVLLTTASFVLSIENMKIDLMIGMTLYPRIFTNWVLCPYPGVIDCTSNEIESPTSPLPYSLALALDAADICRPAREAVENCSLAWAAEESTPSPPYSNNPRSAAASLFSLGQFKVPSKFSQFQVVEIQSWPKFVTSLDAKKSPNAKEELLLPLLIE